MTDMEQKIAIFGTGDFGKKAYQYFGEDKVRVFLDNDPKKQGEILFGVPILSLEAFLPMKGDCELVIAVRDNEDIIRQLIANGFEQFYTFLSVLGHGLVHKVSASDWTMPKEQMRQCALEKAGKYDADVRKWDICLTGLYTELNYGAELTCLALYTYLNSLGYTVLMNQPPLEAKVRPNRFPPLFKENPYPLYDLSRIYDDVEEMKELNECAKFFVLGSDQMWNLDVMRNRGCVSFMEFVNGEKGLLAYATSFGKQEWNEAREDTLRMQLCLDRFHAVSVRESSGVEICEKIFTRDAVQCMDPVFLMEGDFYRKLADKSACQVDENTISAFLFHDDETYQSEIRKFAVKHDFQMNSIAVCSVFVEDWLKQIMKSKIFITNSFHGVCFAIILKVNFIAVELLWPTRISELLKMLGLESRIVKDIKEINAREELLQPIDFAGVYETLHKKVNVSKKWLNDRLEELEKMYVE